MSADGAGGWPAQAGESWRLTLPCTRAEAEAAMAADGEQPLGGHEPAPVLMVTEPDAATPEAWRIDVHVEGAPSPALLAAVRALAPGTATAPRVERIADEDWVLRSQAFLEPIRAGRFFVHTAAHARTRPTGAIAFRIEASRAFGTGHHETTAGCLELLDRMATTGRAFAAIADIGTGTGLLALAAHALWPAARVIASDIDPVAIEIAAENLLANGVAAGAVALAVADGVDAPALRAAAPFDLVVANILAGPLIALAPGIARLTAPDGIVVLAGLLGRQEEAVAAAYAAAGFARADRLQRGDWPVIALVRGGGRLAGGAVAG